MRNWLFVFLIACGGSPKPASEPIATQPPPPPPGDKPAMVASGMPQCPDALAMSCIMDTFDYLQRSMCNCKDRACADKVNTEMTNWGNEMTKKGAAPKPTEEETKRMTESVTKLAECMTKIMGNEQAIPDPCGGGSDPCGGE